MRVLYLTLLLLVVLPVFADDQEKAEKQIKMMTALSRDEIARSIISRTFADVFKVSRGQLLAERRSMARDAIAATHGTTNPSTPVQ